MYLGILGTQTLLRAGLPWFRGLSRRALCMKHGTLRQRASHIRVLGTGCARVGCFQDAVGRGKDAAACIADGM
jgi:hypothetical protein